ncbi:MAG: PAS domain S-box protein [Acidobacteria bacterium]|nr:PAS domain S-box protein [Acidobacteriota bacterium]
MRDKPRRPRTTRRPLTIRLRALLLKGYGVVRSPKGTIYVMAALGILLLGIGLLNLADRIRWSDPTDLITWDEQEKNMVVKSVDKESGLASIAPGDRLLAINRREIKDRNEYLNLLFELRPGETAVYRFWCKKTDEIKNETVVIAGRPILNIKDFFQILLAFLYLFIGTIVFVRSWRNRGGIHFFLVCLFAYVFYLYSYTNYLTFLDKVVYWMSVLSMLVLPPLFLHFCLNFPVRKSAMRNKGLMLTLLYGPSVLLLLVEVLWFSGKLKPFGLILRPYTLELLDNIHIIYFITYFVFSIGVLFHNRFTLQTPELKQQMKWIITGTVLAVLPFCFLYLLPYMLNLEITSAMQASILSLALLPLSFAYAIMKFRLTDVDIILKQGAAYFIASATILLIYFLLIGLSGLIFQSIFPGSDTLTIAFSALAAAFLFAPIRSRVQQEVDRFFYKEEYKHRRSLIEFGRTLGAENDLQTVTSTIMDRVVKSLKVETVAIFLKNSHEDTRFTLVAHVGLTNLPAYRSVFEIPEEFFISETDALPVPYRVFDEKDAVRLNVLRTFYENLSLYYFQHLVFRNEVMGAIALGRSRWETFLSSEDVDLLRMLSGYAAIALENARLYWSLQNKARELESLKAYSESIIEGISVGVVALDPHGSITTWNSCMEHIFGLRARESLGKRFEDVFPADVYASILKALGTDSLAASAETANIYKLFMENVQGEARFINLSVSPFLDSAGQPIGTLMVFDDITAKVQLEKQLLQTEKLSSLGLITAGVAHEVNTPLTGISSFTQFLINELPSESPHQDILRKIEKQCFRASDIVSNLLNFSRMNTDEFLEVQVNKVIEETVNLIEHQFRKQQTALDRHLQPDLPVVKGNEGRLMQVFINILLNARDAVSANGRVTIRTFSDDKFVNIQIMDNGRGIPTDMIHRIYDPFFTTKDTGKGTGLGLAVSYGIVQEHAGRIFVDSRPGEGSCFTIKLPRGRKASATVA